MHWKSHDPSKVARIKKILAHILEPPFTRIGKPEALLHDLQGFWSRRIDCEHRLVYEVTDDSIIVITCRYHYQK